jgi:hypothetical protein
MTKKQLAQIVKQIERHKAGIAKHRDELREIMNQIDELESIAEDAVQSIEYAIDRLSEQL